MKQQPVSEKELRELRAALDKSGRLMSEMIDSYVKKSKDFGKKFKEFESARKTTAKLVTKAIKEKGPKKKTTRKASKPLSRRDREAVDGVTEMLARDEEKGQ